MINNLHKFYLQEMGIELLELRRESFIAHKLNKISAKFADLEIDLLVRGNPVSAITVLDYQLNANENLCKEKTIDEQNLLNNMMMSIGLSESDYYNVTIAIKNPDVLAQVSFKLQYDDLIFEYMKILNSRAILMLISPLEQQNNNYIIKTDAYVEKKIITTYNPKYLLENQLLKRDTYFDLLQLNN